jgi:hypothetical protein
VLGSGNIGIDLAERLLLDTDFEVVAVVARPVVGAPMTVRQTIAMAHLGSPATLHKRLMRLRAGNFLQLQDVAGDRRVKQLVAGARGIEYIESMGRHLLKAKRSPSGRPAGAEAP